MPLVIAIEAERKLDTPCGYDFVFDSLVDIPYSAEHFPRLAQLVDLGDESYRWELEKIGLDRYYVQTVYACQYTWDAEEGWIAWEPAEDDAVNAYVRGRWKIQNRGNKGTKLALTTSAEFHLPIPALAKVLISPLVRREFDQNLDQYIANLQETWAENA